MKTLSCEKPEPGPEWETRKALWDAANVPTRHKDTRPTEPGPWMDSKARLISLLGSGSIVVLTGKRGCGKTQLGVEAIRSYCWGQYSATYTKAIDVFLSIREGMADKSERAAVKPYLVPDLLVIDAMEERGETAFEDRMLSYIIDVRYDAMKDSVLITNQTKERFAESAGASIVSRIHETGATIECDWESFRGRKLAGGAA